MSLVSHDSTWKYQNGVTEEPNNDKSNKKKARDKAPEREVINETEPISSNDRKQYVDNFSINEASIIVSQKTNSTKHDENASDDTRDSETTKRKDDESTQYKVSSDTTHAKINNDDNTSVHIISCENTYTTRNGTITYFDKQEIHKYGANKLICEKFVKTAGKTSNEKKTWERSKVKSIWMKYRAEITSTHCKRRSSSFNSVVLILLVMLNVAGQSNAIEASTFSSGLTSRMIASILGYPSTCTLGSEVRECSLTLSCWLRGGTRLRACGGWLFSCCGDPQPAHDFQANSIPSSEWKYKPSPPKLRQVPQRNVMPNNVFRRRVDDDSTQMDCGLPSSKILQKRIIGGREARFAEFPWQAHVRISEFQCGGVLVSRRYVATAAHCVSRAHTRDIAVWLGAIDTSATHHPARKLGVIQKILHPLFQFRMTQPDRYDIALLKLSRPITYMSHILPICLPDHDMELRGRSGVIAGWGKTDASSGHTGTNLLRSATVPILSKEQCINWHQSKQISVEIHSEMICAGHPDGHQDACLGDSGGPLIVLDSGRYYLVGITSAGFGCGVDHQPGIYHNVKLTANWIRGVISPSVNYNDNYLK